MFCTKCQNPIVDCTCDDIEERLRSLGQHPNFATDRCATCGEHAAECTCETFDPADPETMGTGDA